MKNAVVVVVAILAPMLLAQRVQYAHDRLLRLLGRSTPLLLSCHSVQSRPSQPHPDLLLPVIVKLGQM
jgi:hypothetical protein